MSRQAPLIERVSGKAVGDARLGTNTDLAMLTWQENVRVMVVNTRTISRDTADEVLDNAVQYAAVAGERDKTSCAIPRHGANGAVTHNSSYSVEQPDP